MDQPMTWWLWLILLGIGVAGVAGCMVVDSVRAVQAETARQLRMATPWRPDTVAAHRQALALVNDPATIHSELAARSGR